MDIKEARQVPWLKPDRRPMGELYDEGYLTRSRLEWAAESGYTPRLREAAKAFLKPLPPGTQAAVAGPPHKLEGKPFDVGITLADARAKIWPFPPYRGEPMGPLVDSRQLTFRDLGYAIDTALDKSVRRSAAALLLNRLRQIVEQRSAHKGQVQVISGGRSYAERKQFQLTFLQGAMSGLMLGLFVVSTIWLATNMGRPRASAKHLTDLVSTPGEAIALALVLVLFVAVCWLVLSIPDFLDRRLQKQIDEHRHGQEGEDRAAQTLVQALDSDWKVFRNLEIPGHKRRDVDLILVGPPGVWALEVKNLSGEYRNVGDTWERKTAKLWKRSEAQPSEQARRSAGHLGAFLKADGVNDWVNPAVVWANPENRPVVENPSVAVWTLERLPDELGNAWQGKLLPAATKDKIIDKLTRLCEGQRKAAAK
jgi:hypothetical protein